VMGGPQAAGLTGDCQGVADDGSGGGDAHQIKLAKLGKCVCDMIQGQTFGMGVADEYLVALFFQYGSHPGQTQRWHNTGDIFPDVPIAFYPGGIDKQDTHHSVLSVHHVLIATPIPSEKEKAD